MDRQEWLKWRKGGIGSSDAPIVMGVSPYKTPLSLYHEKLNPEVKEESNFIMDKGNRMEPKIRALFELKDGRSFPPALVQSAEFPWQRASLDGRASDEICEIKLIGKEHFESGQVPVHYVPQVQHQLLVSGATLCHFIMYYDREGDEQIRPENFCRIIVYPDRDYQAELMKAEIEFWDGVQRRKPPEASEADFVKIRGMAKTVNKYRRILQKIKALEEEIEPVREELVKVAKESGHPRVFIGTIKAVQISREGGVDYKSIPELAGIDLDKYRKSGSTYWKLEA